MSPPPQQTLQHEQEQQQVEQQRSLSMEMPQPIASDVELGSRCDHNERESGFAHTPNIAQNNRFQVSGLFRYSYRL